jgi:acyl-CoA synthetase (AMP-forming)/AMP-acid ligase II
VGHRGPIAKFLEDTTFLVRYDPETEGPWRDPKTGFCVRVKTGEAGEAIGRIRDLKDLTRYLGNDTATEAKIIRNVFKKGDIFQRSGDLLMFDEDGWIHFVDRVGDTYRWKGENVAAGEVRDHVAALDGVVDATIYGLRLEAYDGQAGCAAIFLQKGMDVNSFMSTLWKKLRKRGVPTYAIPRLIRVENHQYETIST